MEFQIISFSRTFETCWQKNRSFYCSIFGLKNTESKCRRIFFRLLLLLQKQNEYLSNEWTSLGALRQFRNDKMKNKVENFFQKKEILTQKKVEKVFDKKRPLPFLFFFSSNVNRWFSQFQKQTLKFVSIFNFTNSQKKLTHKIAICVVKLSLSIYLYLYWFVSYVVGSTFISLA